MTWAGTSHVAWKAGAERFLKLSEVWATTSAATPIRNSTLVRRFQASDSTGIASAPTPRAKKWKIWKPGSHCCPPKFVSKSTASILRCLVALRLSTHGQFEKFKLRLCHFYWSLPLTRREETDSKSQPSSTETAPIKPNTWGWQWTRLVP